MICDGHRYEDEYDYLERLNLLFPEEVAVFEQYGAIINVHVSTGQHGKCAQCWERAREIAKRIGFDLESAIQRYEFWVPGEMYLPCEHLPCYHEGEFVGIFDDAD